VPIIEPETALEKTRQRSRTRSNQVVDFFRGFLKEPRQVGSVIPSSRFMERKIIDFSGLDGAGIVVELGPGTGGTTRALLAAMDADAKLLAVDVDPRFTEIVAGIDDPRLIAHTGSAADIGEILRQHGLEPADVVISGIPFSTMPRDLGLSILEAVRDSLSERGVFVAYQFRAEVARLAETVFGPARRTAPVPLNIPPMRIWQWARPAQSAGRSGEG
jgi:phospholipid N-methyltransferase